MAEELLAEVYIYDTQPDRSHPKIQTNNSSPGRQLHLGCKEGRKQHVFVTTVVLGEPSTVKGPMISSQKLTNKDGIDC